MAAPSGGRTATAAVATAAIVEKGEAVEQAEADVAAAMSDESTRNLVFRFWNLTVSQRREIALRLELITEDELQVAEPERYGRALLRAGNRGQPDALAREVAHMEIR